MKLRIIPIVASVAVSALLMFGGWYAYQQWGVESPFEKAVEKYDGVQQIQLDMTKTQVVAKLDLASGSNLGDIIRQMEEEGKKWIGDRELKVEVTDQSPQSLNDVWEEALFPVAQAMENKQYTEITATLDELQQKNDLLAAKADMDENNVYITLTDAQGSKFIILPRAPQKLGVL
ncbi:hypothetical protein D3C76_182930 [compost metagenome]